MKNIIIITALIFMNIAVAQNSINPDNCTYAESDVTLTLNGWDVSRTDYDHYSFINTARLRQYTNLEYSGEKDTAEFGYPWFYYKLNNNFIQFAGLLDTPNFNYSGRKKLFSFKINSGTELNLNNIEIGDSTQEIFNLFSNYCMEDDMIVVFHGYSTVSFEFNPSTDTIESIAYDTQL